MFAALRHRNFRLLWVTTLVSNLGTWMQVVAQDYLVYQLSGRALDLGLVYLVRAIPLITLSIFGGALADRFDRRRLLMWTQGLMAASALLLGLLVQSGAARLWHVVAFSFVNAALQALDQPVRQAILPDLVSRKDLTNAIALNAIGFSAASAVGPALAGPVVSAIGFAWGFHLNALSFLVMVWAIYLLKLPAPMRQRAVEPAKTALPAGVRYVLGSPNLLLLISLLMVFGFFAFPYQALMPVFAQRVFGGGVQVFGWLRATLGFGALVGGFLLARFAGFPYKGWLVLGSGVGFSFLVVAFSCTQGLPMALPLLFGASLAFTLFQATAQSLLQQLTSDEMRGRVMGLWAVAMLGMWPLGTLPLTWAADRFGPGVAVAAGAAIAGIFGFTLMVTSRRSLRAVRASDVGLS
jgi:MFS family permease